MTVRPVSLDAADAVEFGELLVFLVGWLGCDASLAASFDSFVGDGGYDIDGLRSDLLRFAFLLGGDVDGAMFVNGER
jgi:hypothetical protein